MHVSRVRMWQFISFCDWGRQVIYMWICVDYICSKKESVASFFPWIKNILAYVYTFFFAYIQSTYQVQTWHVLHIRIMMQIVIFVQKIRAVKIKGVTGRLSTSQGHSFRILRRTTLNHLSEISTQLGGGEASWASKTQLHRGAVADEEINFHRCVLMFAAWTW